MHINNDLIWSCRCIDSIVITGNAGETEKTTGKGNVAFVSHDGARFLPSAQLHLVNAPTSVQETDLQQPLPPLFDLAPKSYLPPPNLGAFEPASGRSRSEQRACGLSFFMHPQTGQPRAPLPRYSPYSISYLETKIA